MYHLLQQAANMLQAADDIAIIIHNRPDGDAIGSSHALYHALRQLGKRVGVLCSDEAGRQFHCITKNQTITALDFEPRFVVLTDVSSFAQLGEQTAALAKRADLVLDHHKVSDPICDTMLVDPTAAAAGELIFALLRQMEVPLDQEIALALYCALATDTGCFRFGNTTARTHEIAAILMRTGIDVASFNKLFFETKSRARVLLEQAMLDSLSFHYRDTLAIAAVTLDMLARCHAGEDETGQISNLTSEIEGVKVGVTIKQQSASAFKISMRSVREIDVAEICRQVGGGGHAQAAGCLLHGTLDEVVAQIVGLFAAVLP